MIDFFWMNPKCRFSFDQGFHKRLQDNVQQTLERLDTTMSSLSA
jgi:hypothetical protein